MGQRGFSTRFYNRMAITGQLRYSFERVISQDLIFYVFDRFDYLNPSLGKVPECSDSFLLFYFTAGTSLIVREFLLDNLPSRFVTDLKVIQENIYVPSQVGKFYVFVSTMIADNNSTIISYRDFDTAQVDQKIELIDASILDEIKFGYFYTKNDFAEEFRFYGIHNNCLVSTINC